MEQHFTDCPGRQAALCTYCSDGETEARCKLHILPKGLAAREKQTLSQESQRSGTKSKEPQGYWPLLQELKLLRIYPSLFILLPLAGLTEDGRRPCKNK